jgi:Xaa-Pro aminopeptidase
MCCEEWIENTDNVLSGNTRTIVLEDQMDGIVVRFNGDFNTALLAGEGLFRIRQQHIEYLAELAGVNGILAGLTGREGDAIVREVITSAGYGDQFGHGTGHGVGLEVHEAPRVSRTGNDILPAGSIITVEPGIYLPDIGGVRIEDMCLVTETGVEIITGTAKPAELPIYG